MNKFEEFESKKFLIILFLICAVFLVLIITAFQYIPEPLDKGSNRSSIENINQPAEEQVSEEQAESDEESAEPQDEEIRKSKKELNITLPKFGEDKEALESIEELPNEAKVENETPSTAETKPAELSKEEQLDRAIFKAYKSKKNRQFVQAIEEFQSVATMADDVSTKAKCYEEIATIHAIVKRYGTALSYAQKAYNMSPSSSREMLLARLYYKTGDIDKATRRINNVLQRDFSSDR